MILHRMKLPWGIEWQNPVLCSRFNCGRRVAGVQLRRSPARLDNGERFSDEERYGWIGEGGDDRVQ